MEIVILIVTVLGMIGVILLMSYFLAFKFGLRKIFVTLPKTNDVEFSMRGESLRKVIPNVPGYGIKRETITANIGNAQRIIHAHKLCPISEGGIPVKFLWGLASIGPLWPFDKILTYSFSWDRPSSVSEKEKEEKKGAKIETFPGDIVVSHRSEKVTSLRYWYNYSITLKDIELEGRYKINIFLNITIEAVYVDIPVIYLDGDWFKVFVSKCFGVVSDGLKGMAINDFEDLPKMDFLKEKITGISEEILLATGMRPAEITYRDYSAAGTKEEQEAFIAEQVAILKGKARLAEASAEAKSIIKLSNAEAIALRRLKIALGNHPDTDKILSKYFEQKGLEKFRGQFLNYGGGSQSPLVAVNAPTTPSQIGQPQTGQKNNKGKGGNP